MNTYRPKNILVTGGAGFIGSNFIKHLLSNYSDIQIINLDKLTYAANLNNLKTCSDKVNYSFFCGDILDGALVSNLLAQYKIETIVHFAAETHVDNSIDSPDAFISTNIMGTHSLLKSALDYWRTQFNLDEAHCRFHHISTDEVFGALGQNDAPFNANSPYQPNSPYSASKAASDHLVRAYHKTYQLPMTISNCSNNYGLHQHSEKLIPKIVQACMNWLPIPIYGDGSNIRDWLHVNDHCRAIDSILRRGEVGECFLIGGDNELNNLSLAEMICDLMDSLFPREKSHRTLISFVQDRPGHDWRYAIDASKIHTQLNWKPEIKMEDGLKALIRANSPCFSL